MQTDDRLIDRLLATLIILAGAGFAAADDPPPQTEPPPAIDPLGRLIEQMFKGMQARPLAPPAQLPRTPERTDRSAPAGPPQITLDAVDSRAPIGRNQKRSLDLARRLLADGQQYQSLSVTRELLDSPEDALYLTDDGRWESLHGAVEQLLNDGGAEFQAAYERRFGAQAANELDRAKRSGDSRKLAQVTRRFLHTRAGREAAVLLAERFRDLGERAEAQWWMQRANPDRASEPAAEVPVVAPNDPPLAALHGRSDDWTQPYGGPTHLGRAPSADPILIERWSQPTAVRPSVADQVRQLTQDLVDSGRACLPAAIPLAVDGKLVSRTLRGVSVFDAETGRLLWETAEGASVERLLSGEEAPRPGGEPSGRSLRMVPAYRGTNPDAQQLTGLLYRDGVYGLLSSDGEQLFVLEDHATLSYRQPGYFWSQRQTDDPFERDWSTNQLTAYDLETGSVRWRIGGQRRSEPFDPPLAGTLFLGPPVVDRDELFLIGEENSTLSLYCLDRRTGEPLWSHAVSGAGAKIDQDLVRRWWPAQPAVGAGVVVCPTTQGWLVAVDRLERRIRWAYRYIENRQKRVSANRPRVASAGLLNSRWAPAAPLLTDRYLVFTPPELPDPLYGEDPLVVCLDVLTGERLWRHPKGSNLYLGGAFGDRVLLIGSKSVEARDAATKKLIWKTSLDVRETADSEDDVAQRQAPLEPPGQPSGRGVIAGDEYLLPLQSGQLWFIDLNDGKVRRTMALRSRRSPLGNLIVHQGRLFSLGPLSVRAFESREAVTATLAAGDSQTLTPADRLRAAELSTIELDFAAARRTLLALLEEGLTETERERRNDLLWKSLVQLVRGDLQGRDAEFAELTELADSHEQRLAVERLQADRLQARGRPADAFDVYWKQAQAPRQTMVAEAETSVRIDRWLAGRLHALWEAAPQDVRSEFERKIRRTGDQVVNEADASLLWWAEILRFHPAGAALRRTLADRALSEQRWAAGETYLRQIADEAAAEDVRSGAVERLIQLLHEQGRHDDAAITAQKIADVGSLSTPAASVPPAEPTQAAPIWSEGEWTLRRTPATYNRSRYEPMLAVHPNVPSVARMKLRLEPNLHRLAIETLAGEPIWETPLQAQSQSFYNHSTGVTSVGQLMFVVHRGVLHAVSLQDQELLWRTPFDLQSVSAGFLRGPSLPRQQELRTAEQFVWSDGLRQTKTPLGMLAVWRPDYVAYFGRRSITLADPLTGETFWKRSGVRPQAMIYGTSRTVYVMPKSPERPYALNVLDGTRANLPKLRSLADSAVAVTEGGLVTLREQQPLKLFGWGKRSTQMSLTDPLTGETRWSLNFPEQTRFAHAGDDQIVSTTPAGEVSLVDLNNGSRRTLGRLDVKAVEGSYRWFVVPEGDRLYLALNRHPKPGAYSRSYQSAPVNGTLAAFDRQAGLLWTEPVEDQNLVLDQLAHLPVLVFTAQRPERDGDVTSQQVFVEVRDKRTGRLLLEDARYITGGNVREMSVDHARRLIDLKTYRDRLRLSVAEE